MQLSYIYTRKDLLNISAEDSLNILVASDELELLDLAECAQKHLIKNFSPWLFFNLVKSLNVVCRHNHFHEVYNHVLNFTFRNPYSLFDSVNLYLLDEVAMICILESDDLELEEMQILKYLIRWGISKVLNNDNNDITNWSDENSSNWSDDHFKALKETISRCIPLIRYYYIPKSYINKQIKRYHLDSNTFIKSKTPPRRLDIDFTRSEDYYDGIIGQIFLFARTVLSLLHVPYLVFEKKPYFMKTSNSFIFSFTDQSNPVLSRIKTARNNTAIWNNQSHGPWFGESDLCMKNLKNWTCKWTNYEHRIAISRLLYAEEYEVFAFDNYNSLMNRNYLVGNNIHFIM
ncbi:45692_t:CDS:2 [Gigaspora margarita]|uniref:45692_t:CDS:1 n=1 Tax=Gigaspora margarita TaxID=4874 RepID=A0ABM8W1P5_GIGMA|nr:45692_t:CDS:2 [Gigaspora margarita]